VSDERQVMAEGDGWVFSVERQDTGAVLLHMNVEPSLWSVKMYKEMKGVWKNVLDEFRSRGVVEVFSLIPKDKKIERFQEMFELSPLLTFSNGTLYRRVL